MPNAKLLIGFILLATLLRAHAQTAEKVVDIPTRPGVSQRMIVLAPADPRAAVILLAGGHGGLQIFPNGSMKWGEGNFLVRTRQLFADQGLLVAVVDAPSDRQARPYMQGFRQKQEHVSDLKSVIAWLRATTKLPVWLIGTSRGTQSAAFAAIELTGQPDGPDGIVLSSTILSDENSRPVPTMALDKLRVPVLVVHHEQDGCAHCSFAHVPSLMSKLVNTPRSKLLSFNGGENKGDPCEAFAYHGFNGIERETVRQTAAWILTAQ